MLYEQIKVRTGCFRFALSGEWKFMEGLSRLPKL